MSYTKEERTAYDKAYREANREKIVAYKKTWYKANSDKTKAHSRAYREANLDKEKTRGKIYREANPNKINTYNKAWRKANPDKAKASTKAWQINNPDKLNAYAAKRRAIKLQCTPAWADLEAIKQVYADCEEINIAARLAGCTEKFVVDHIIPLQGTNVSGLHIAINLQIITQKENSEKSNKFTP